MTTSNGPGSSPAPGPHPDHDNAPVAPAKTPKPDLRTVVSEAVGGVAKDVVEGVNTVVQPAAAATVASTFTFPLGLMVFVLLFLFVQPRVDRRDPRLRARTGNAAEPDLGFQEEDAL